MSQFMASYAKDDQRPAGMPLGAWLASHPNNPNITMASPAWPGCVSIHWNVLH